MSANHKKSTCPTCGGSGQESYQDTQIYTEREQDLSTGLALGTALSAGAFPATRVVTKTRTITRRRTCTGCHGRSKI
jgi:hypothetical protein